MNNNLYLYLSADEQPLTRTHLFKRVSFHSYKQTVTYDDVPALAAGLEMRVDR